MKKLLFSLLLGLSLSGLSGQVYAAEEQDAEAPMSYDKQAAQEAEGSTQSGRWKEWNQDGDEDSAEDSAEDQAESTVENDEGTKNPGNGNGIEAVKTNSDGGGQTMITDVAEESDGDKSSMCFVDPVNAVICVVGVIVFTVVVGCAISDAAYYFINDEGDMVCLNYVESW